ncbi:MAG: putative S-layer protein [Candidatus Woesearchaeota archaeon]|nr:MAG: putative S-layer protein [Candidatus Woesearchaeota archaeon]
MEISIKKTILGLISAVFLLGIFGTATLADLDGVDNSDITINNCDGVKVEFILYTNSQNSDYDAPVTVNGVTKIVTIPATHGSIKVGFLAEDILPSMNPGVYPVTLETEDFWGAPVTEDINIIVTGCGLICNVAPDVLDDVDFEDEVAPEDVLEIEIKLDNQEGMKFYDVELKVWIEDEDGDRLGDREETDEFDLSDDEEEEKILKLNIPDDAEEGDYTLFVRAEADEGCLFEEEYDLEVIRDEDNLKIDKVGFDSEVEAGEDFNIAVTILNNGQNDQEDVRVMVELVELDLSQKSQYFDVEEDEKITQYFTLSIPSNADEGEYTLTVEVKGEEASVEKDFIIKIAGEAEEEEEGIKITVEEPEMNLVAGKGGIFKITVENEGDSLETFTFSAAGTIGWATHSIEPGVATIDEGESEDIFLYVSPRDDAEENSYPISFYVKQDGQILESISLTANVEGRAGLEDFGDLTAEQMGVWIFIIVIIIIAILFSVWTYTTATASKKGRRGKEKYY